MRIITQLNEWQTIRKSHPGTTIGFVPTMGNLHEGHMSLCERAKNENEITVVSIFINPTQFNQSSDFDLYPRTLEQDKHLLTDKVDYLFIPSAETMYPDQYEIKVKEDNIANQLEGEFRPGHFDGMLTIVLKLLHLISPQRAYFGEKDYQQLLLIKKMVSALFLPIEIIGCETIRAHDGLAMSSRNNRLNENQRIKARDFPRLLKSNQPVEIIKQQLTDLGFKVDYIIDQWQRRLGAVWVDDVRLIDNISNERT